MTQTEINELVVGVQIGLNSLESLQSYLLKLYLDIIYDQAKRLQRDMEFMAEPSVMSKLETTQSSMYKRMDRLL